MPRVLIAGHGVATLFEEGGQLVHHHQATRRKVATALGSLDLAGYQPMRVVYVVGEVDQHPALARRILGGAHRINRFYPEDKVAAVTTGVPYPLSVRQQASLRNPIERSQVPVTCGRIGVRDGEPAARGPYLRHKIRLVGCRDARRLGR